MTTTTEVRRTTLRQTPSIYGKVVLGVELHEAQAHWVDLRAKTKIGCMGRRFGKTLGEAVDGIWFADSFDGTEQFVVAPTSDQASVITAYMETMIGHGSLYIQRRVDRIIHKPFFEIQFKNGSRIHSRSAGTDGKFLRAHGADRLIRDEDAYIPEVVIREVLPPMLATSKYGETVAISTPFGMNHFREDFARGQLGDADYVSLHFTSYQNPHISREYLERQKAELTNLAFRVEYLAEFAEDQNAVFPWTLIESCFGGDDTENAAPGHLYFIGYDPAKFYDRSGVVVLDATRLPWHVVAVRDISGRNYVDEQLPIIEKLSATYNRALLTVDSTHNEPLLEMMTGKSLSVEGFNFTAGTKQELINNLVIAMEQGRVVFPNHHDLVQELMYYRYELTKAGGVRLGADSKHHDDLVTALALACWGAQHGKHTITGNRTAVGGQRPLVNAYQPR